MKKNYCLILILATMISCHSQKEITKETKTNSNASKSETKIISENKTAALDKNYTGIVTKENLKSGSLKEWFVPNYDAYQPNQTIVDKIDKNIDKYKIKVFMGTWCPDSHREVPKLFKLLDIIDYNQNHLEVITTHRNKTTEQGYEENYDIKFVPTIIFIDKNGKEANRIVEYPQESLEKDILKIVTNQPYQNSYAE